MEIGGTFTVRTVAVRGTTWALPREWFRRERLDVGSGEHAGAEEAQRTGERAEEARGESRAQRGLVTEMVTGPVRTVDWP